MLAAADEGSSTFLLYQSSSGVWVAKRPHTGGLANVQRVSTSGLGGAVFSAGDLVAFTEQWWAVWNEQVGPGGEFAPLKLFQSKTIGAGDCIDPITKQQITFNPSLDDERPSIVLKPASAGASGADLFFARTNGAQGTSAHICGGPRPSATPTGTSASCRSPARSTSTPTPSARAPASTSWPSSGTGPTSST